MKAAIAFGRTAGPLLAANAIGVLCNYGFQVHAARRLPPADFASLFAWLTRFGTFVFAAFVAQNYAQMHLVRRLAPLRAALFGFALTTAALVVAGPPVSATALLVWGTGLTVALSYIVGQRLGHAAFLLVGVSSMLSFFVRVSWFVVGDTTLELGYRATILGIAVNAMLLCAARVAPMRIDVNHVQDKSAFARAAGLAGLQVIAPNIDWMLLDGRANKNVLAQAAVALLFTRLLVIVGLTVAQVTLTQRARAEAPDATPPAHIPRVEKLTVGLVTASAPIVAFLVPWFARIGLHTAPEAIPSAALVAALVMHHAAWLAVVNRYQRGMVAKRTQHVAATVAVVLALDVGLHFSPLEPISRIIVASLLAWTSATFI